LNASSSSRIGEKTGVESMTSLGGERFGKKCGLSWNPGFFFGKRGWFYVTMKVD